MHFMSALRYNPKTQRDEWYYRIKESFRDLTGRVRSRIMLNVGFIEEMHRPEEIRDIGRCLTHLHEHQGEQDLFGCPFAHYNEFVRSKTEEFWTAMVKDTRKQEITLRQVRHEEDGDYYLEISSPAKAVKESSMNRQWHERFEQELTKARDALGRKGGRKTYEKVMPFTYNIIYENNGPNNQAIAIEGFGYAFG